MAILSMQFPDDRISLPQDAVLRIQSRIFRAAPENQDNVMVAKLLVFSNQIGCLLGKGGGIIAEMRKSTGAYIRIVGKDQIPKFAAENEEVIQVLFAFYDLSDVNKQKNWQFFFFFCIFRGFVASLFMI